MAEILTDDKALDRALALLQAGEVVAIPTETVYGLGADATNDRAVAAVFDAKGRPRFNPLIAHVCELEMAERVGVFDPLSRKLAELFWPGPLTLVVPLKVSAVVSCERESGLFVSAPSQTVVPPASAFSDMIT